MPWARWPSCRLEGKTIRSQEAEAPSPLAAKGSSAALARGLGSDNAVSGWNDKSALSTLKDRSVTPMRSRISVSIRQICHLLTAAGAFDPGLPASSTARLTCSCAAIWPSVACRRPKDVVGICASMALAFIRQKKPTHQNGGRLLTVIRGSGLVLVAKLSDKGFRSETSGGLFLLRSMLLWLIVGWCQPRQTARHASVLITPALCDSWRKVGAFAAAQRLRNQEPCAHRSSSAQYPLSA